MTARMYHLCIALGVVLPWLGQDAIGQTIIIDPRPMPPVRPIHPPIPRPFPPPVQRGVPLQVKTHLVDVAIVDGVVVTKIDRVFVNTTNNRVEGCYILPLEVDIAVSDSQYVRQR